MLESVLNRREYLAACLLLARCWLPVLGQDDKPITKEHFFSAIRLGKKQRKNAATFIALVKRFRVDFFLTPIDKQVLRHDGSYLGERGLDDLITAVGDSIIGRVSPSMPASSPPSSPSPTPTTSNPIPAVRKGTELVGISGTGATALIRVISGVRQFGSPSVSLLLEIENTSRSATITNIGFFIKCANKPKFGHKAESRPGEIMKPGVYTFVTNDVEISTRDFKAISAFGFMTGSDSGVSTNFLMGHVGLGIAPGVSMRFAISGDGFLGDITAAQLERGTILRFQGSGWDDINDIAVIANLAVLFSPSDPIYQIYKNR